MSYFIVLLSLVIGGVFGVSAVSKIHSFAGFRDAVRGIGRVPAPLATPVALTVVTLESLAGAAALLPATAPAALGLALVLLTVFTPVLYRAVRRGTTQACRCFGTGDEPVARRHVVRNLVLIAVAGAGLTARLLAGPPGVSVPGLLLCLLVAGVAVAGVVLLDDLTALLRPLAR